MIRDICEKAIKTFNIPTPKYITISTNISKKVLSPWILFGGVFFWTTIGFSQPSIPPTSQISYYELPFSRYSAKNGLAEIVPYGHTMTQSNNGFIWVPSLTGLNRFDGRDFKVYQCQPGSNEGPSNNYVFHVCEDGRGKLWVSVRSGLMNIFDPETETFTEIGADLPPELKRCVKASLRAISDRHGNVWVSAQEGICHCDVNTMTFRHFDLRGEKATALLEQRNGQVWAGTVSGLYRLFPELDSVAFYEPYPEYPGIREYNKIETMAEAVNGEIWASSGRKGQRIFNPATGTFRDFPKALRLDNKPAYLSITSSSNGEIWMGTNNTIARYNPDNQHHIIYASDKSNPTSMQHGAIVSLLEDRNGSLWTSGYGSTGLAVTHARNNPFQVLPQHPYHKAIPLDSSRMLFGTRDGFKIFDIRTEQFLTDLLPAPMQAKSVNWLQKAGNGDIWWRDPVQNKIFKYNFETNSTDVLDNQHDFAIDPENNLWLKAQVNRIIRYETQKKTWTDLSEHWEQLAPPGYMDAVQFTTMTFDQSGRLWVGSIKSGLLRYEPSLDSLRIYQHQPGVAGSLPAGSINGLETGSDNRIYFRSEVGIGIYLPKEDSFHLVNTGKDVPWFIMEGSDGHLWFGGKSGLSRMRFTDYHIDHFDYNDGLHFGQLQGLLKAIDANGYHYMLKMGQLIRFHPDSLQQKAWLSPVVFTDFYLNRRRVKPGQEGSPLHKHIQYQRELVLRHDQSEFGFRFVSPTYYKPEKIHYYYQLENYNTDWVSTGNQLEVHFTNIPAGRYFLHIKAQSAAGNWVKREQPIEIKVRPPWWEAWWACLIYFFILLALVYFIYQYQLRKQLAEAEAERLQEMDRLKTKLYTNITHEFRTPLTVILGMSDQIKQNPKAAQQLIRRNSKNLLHLVNQLLDMSKLESKKMQLRPVRSNIVSHLRYLTQSFESYAATKQIELVFETDLHELVMDFDPDKMQHLITNLLSNAIKFTPEKGRVTLSVSEGPRQLQSPQQPLVRIKVADTGMGIKEEDLPHIFDRFFQVDASSTRQVDGTGIGLALARELVELMGGTISVESEWASGTTFTILLPVIKEAPASLPGSKETNLPLPVEGTPPHQTPGDKTSGAESSNLPLLLIIEDNPDVIAYIMSILRLRYQMQVAPNGHIGIEMAIEFIPDIIISDVMMPGKDGFEVTHTLKNDERTSHIPIILLTARDDAASRLEGLQRGADAYLSKPFDQQELLVRLEKLVELRQKLQSRYQSMEPLPPTHDQGLQMEDAFLKKINELLELHLSDHKYGVAELCKDIAMSQPQLYRKIKALTGHSTSGFIRHLRLKKAKKLIETTNMGIAEIAYKAGFSSPAYFSRAFSEAFGVPPTSIRK